MISTRTMACLFEIISDIDVAHTISLLQSIDAGVSNLQPYYEPTPHYKKELNNTLIGLDAAIRIDACSAAVSLKKTLRTLTNPKFMFDERWKRFERSLRLDGFKIIDETIISEDPIAEQLINTEDSLASLIHEAGVIKQVISSN